MNVLPFEVRVRLAAMLAEGGSIRATERQTGVHRDTVMRWGVDVGEACARLHDHRVRGLYGSLWQLDEIWTFVGKKEGHLKPEDDPEFGDAYTFVAMDADSKLVGAFRTGKRTADTTQAFCNDLRARIVGAPQISTDGFRQYVGAIEAAFGSRVHHGTAVKIFEEEGDAGPEHRYAPGRVLGIDRARVSGAPIEEKISTSYVERGNLTIRTHCRRFTRLCVAFSKRLRNLRAAVALHCAWYNFVRVHRTLRVTPAMQAGLTDHVWSPAELVEEALLAPLDPPAPAPVAAPSRAPMLRVIRGGRS